MFTLPVSGITSHMPPVNAPQLVQPRVFQDTGYVNPPNTHVRSDLVTANESGSQWWMVGKQEVIRAANW
jgi:hypothetical protein